MRTTLTLDPDVAAMLRKSVARGDRTFKQAVNDALRKGLAEVPSTTPRKRFVQRLMPAGDWLVEINNNSAIQEMWDREDYGDLHRREPSAPGDGPEGQ